MSSFFLKIVSIIIAIIGLSLSILYFIFYTIDLISMVVFGASIFWIFWILGNYNEEPELEDIEVLDEPR